ncbi:amine oxidase [Plakobranchus ocellatus]|uniref:Amine oxidase n=1 Tax=Plakobranchus ocellatus TaxID=259542 RepID=A0AAV3ZZS1_9GAST|nr:amine oxidase [Plakobranchus ocellatus]
MCNKCYFQLKNILKRHSAPSLLKAGATYEEHKNKWCSFDETLKSDQCASCRHRASLTTGCLRRQSLCQPTLNNKKTSQTTHPSSCDRLVEKSNSTAARQTDQHENETSPITDSNYVEMTDTERLYESQHIAQTSMTIIDQLQQLTHCIIAETSATSRDDSHHMTAPSETTIDNIQYIGSHDVPHSSEIHFTPPFIPIAESAPLKSSRTQTVTVDTSTSPMFKHDKSFSQSLGLSENAPLSKEEEKLSTHLVRRKLNSDPGPQGTYPCLWCLMPRRDMHNPRDHCEHRSLESLLADNKTFMQQTDGEKKQANKFYNSLHAPLVGIELGKVSPPYLHILLGVVLKHHKLLEDAAYKLDKKVACQPDDFLLPLGKLLKRYGSQWGRAYELQERLLYEEGCLGFSELNDSQEQIDKYTQQIHKTELISFLMHKELQPRKGPIASSLDTVLTKHRITPQAYHSRSFVGNHCHKYLQSAVYTDLTQIIVTKTQQCTSNPMIIDEACTLQLLFDNLNNAFSTVHRAISHTKPIALSSLLEIEIAIDTYMATYRRMFPRKIIPKKHLLEKHCIPHIKQHLFGLGPLGEQGTENSHQMIGVLETRARGIKNDMCKLKFILSSHLLQVAPATRDSV